MDFQYFPITEKELSFFEPLLPENRWDYMEDDGELLFIGAADGEGVPAGILVLCVYREYLAQLLHIFVRPSLRRQGLGKGMLDFVLPVLKNAGIKVLHTIAAKSKEGEGQEDLLSFLDSFGAGYRMITDHMVSLPAKGVLRKLPSSGKHCAYMETVPESDLEQALMQEEADIFGRVYYFVERGGGTITQACDPVSCVYRENGEIVGMMFFVPRVDKKGTVLIFMKGKDARCLYDMFSFSAHKAIEEYGEEGIISFAAVNNIGKEMGQLFKNMGLWLQSVRAVIPLE